MAVTLGGCSALFGSRSPLNVVIENYRDEAIDLGINIIDPDVSDRSKALVYNDAVEVSANAVGDQQRTLQAVAPAQQCRIEVTDGPDGPSSHYHYKPDCLGGDAPYDPTVHMILNANPGISFSQTRCHGKIASKP
jgi:hypothetical protein